MKKEPTVKPIIFSSEMVRALLEGGKTQTRRYAHTAIERVPHNATWAPDSGFKKTRRVGQIWSLHSPYLAGSRLLHGIARCPYKPGDLLWVRETLERAKGEAIGYPSDCSWLPNTPWTWKRDTLPAMFMPRWASRLTLRVTNVRAERLQDISEDDARAEGVRKGGVRGHTLWSGRDTERPTLPSARQAFLDHIWTDLYGEHETKSVGANPWVWVYEFEVIRKNVGEVMA